VAPDRSGSDPRTWSEAELLALLYDWEHDDFAEDLPFYQALAQRTDRPVLELACGTGRVLAALAETGLRVAGIDRSEAMLARAKERLRAHARQVELMLGDVERRMPSGEFGVVILALSALGYIPTVDRQVELLRRVSAQLADDGIVVIDLPGLSSLVHEPEGVAVLQRSGWVEEMGTRASKWMVQSIDWATQSLLLTSFFDVTWSDRTTHRLTDAVSLRWFAPIEIALVLGEAGLEIEQVFGSYDGASLRSDSERMIVIARNRAEAPG
jgi:SAM-dependent methyltransferase